MDLPAGSQIHDVISVVHLKRYNGENKDVRPLSIIPGNEDTEPEWEVESIEGERRYKGGIPYLVHWKGFAERTWEPEKYLENAPEVIADWRNSRADGEELNADARESKSRSRVKKSTVDAKHKVKKSNVETKSNSKIKSKSNADKTSIVDAKPADELRRSRRGRRS